MTMNADIPGDLSNLLGSLFGIERDLTENSRKCASGESIAGELDRARLGFPINIIPRGIPGRCQTTLLVCVGYNDDVEKRVLQAYEHISAKCPDTKNVIFFAAAWYGLSWKKYSSHFRGVTAVLKPFFAEPTLLNT